MASSQESREAPADGESGGKGCGVTGDMVLAFSRTFLGKGLSFCLSKMLELGRGRGTFASFLSLLRKCLSKFYQGPSIKQGTHSESRLNPSSGPPQHHCRALGSQSHWASPQCISCVQTVHTCHPT